MSLQKRQPSVAIIGAGRLGSTLGYALAGHGYVIKAVVARHRKSAERAAGLISSRPLALVATQLDLLPLVDLLLITTPDDLIAKTAARLAASLKIAPYRRIALHASGALSSDELAPLREKGFSAGSMHPLVSISDPVAGADSLHGAFFCVEGDSPAISVARRIVRALGGQSFSINARDKALYHAAAVMTSGHTVALIDMAIELLADCGLSKTRARRVLLPLWQSTLRNLAVQNPSRALTGTFARADVRTVRRHLAALHAQPDSDAIAAYILLGQRSLQLAKENGIDATAFNDVVLALEKAEGGEQKAEGSRQ